MTDSVIQLTRVPTVRIDDFARKHGFTIEIHERPKYAMRFATHLYYAHFKGVESKDGPILTSETGNGDTPLAALADYCQRIEGKFLVKDAYGEARQEVIVNCNLTTDGVEL